MEDHEQPPYSDEFGRRWHEITLPELVAGFWVAVVFIALVGR